MDIIKLDVPLFIRLLELAREDIKQDADLHDIAEAVTRLSAHGPATMEDYDKIVQFMQKQGSKSQGVDESKSSINFGGRVITFSTPPPPSLETVILYFVGDKVRDPDLACSIGAEGDELILFSDFTIIGINNKSKINNV